LQSASDVFVRGNAGDASKSGRRLMLQFILGALTGGLAAWWWRRDIQSYMDQKLPQVRAETADRLIALEQRAEEALRRARHQIDRMRTGEAQHARDTREMPSHRPGTYTQGTGV
jgi:ABC-type nickel/cobalt efflux system permease component RcnA